MGILIGKEITFKHDFNNAFKEAYYKNPKKTLRIMEMCISELGYEVDENLFTGRFAKIQNFLSKEKNRLIIYAVIGFILSFFALEGFLICLACCAFFLPGHCIALFGKKSDASDIIALFSHGLLGLILMYFAFLMNVMPNIFASKLYYFLFVLAVCFGVCGFVRTLLIRLSSIRVPFRDTVFIFYLVGFLCLAIIRILVFIETGGVLYGI